MDEFFESAKTTQQATGISETTNWLEDIRETIVIFGAPKVGKTFAYLGIVESELKKNPQTQFYIINTDGGLARTFKEYFGDKTEEVRKSIHYYFASDIKKAIDSLNKIREIVKKDDWLIMDLMSDFWEMSQDEFIRQSGGGDITNYIINASKDVKKFGMFESQKWLYVKKLDNEMTSILPSSPICNIVGVCAEKDLDVENKITKGSSKMVSLYRELMARPAGQKQIAYKFNTILYIQSAESKNVTVFGDRGKLKMGQKFSYDKNMWDAFLGQRERGKLFKEPDNKEF